MIKPGPTQIGENTMRMHFARGDAEYREKSEVVVLRFPWIRIYGPYRAFKKFRRNCETT